MIRVLHIVSSLGSGGVESMLWIYYQNIDRNHIRFDFVVHETEEGMLERKFKDCGSTVHHVTPKRVSFIKNALEINDIIRNGNYDIVHSHQNLSGFTGLFCAKLHNVNVRIHHSHSSKPESTVPKKMVAYVLKKLNHRVSNYYFSGSLKAGKWLHGKKWVPDGANLMMRNVIDTNMFKYDEALRKSMRKSLDLEQHKVLLHVGRFSEEKNHQFLIEVFERVVEKTPNARLVLIGEGFERPSIEALVTRKNLNHAVQFIGKTHQVADYMNAADVFLLPSKHEGFGIVLLEAQTSGLRVFASDTIPRDAAVTELIEFLDLNDHEVWVNKICEAVVDSRIDRVLDVETSGYSLSTMIRDYELWLTHHVTKHT